MIRINLLGTGKSKKGRRGFFAKPTINFNGPKPWLLAVLLILLYGAGLWWYQRRLEERRQTVQKDIIQADQNIASMSKVKQAFLERQREYDAVKRRFDVIDQLRAAQGKYPADLLDEISTTVNHTEGVWLISMKDDGANVSLEGTALGPNAVANLMTNLRRSGYFKNVELKDTAQEDNPKIQTFGFTMVCEKAKA